jgi:EAL domain-containing protein (putative c-di-GMP-specific phosphodiesterase class I)
MTTMQQQTSAAMWFLSQRVPSDSPPRIVPLSAFPFTVGRLPHSSLCLALPDVSKQHAEFNLQQGRLVVRDLGSTNGTFVNNRRVEGAEPLHEGDAVQFATEVFRVSRQQQDSLLRTVNQPLKLVASLCQFDNMMSERAVVPHFQPIVELFSGRIMGFEHLARGCLPGLETPDAMFQAAEKIGQEVPLSIMLRHEGVLAAKQFAGRPTWFFNTHAKEVGTPELLAALKDVRAIAPDQDIAIEVHEAAVADEQRLWALRQTAHRLNMKLAYDDFGAGQARLDELARVAPDFVKFDMRLVRDLHRATSERRLVTSRLVELVRELGIVPLAEGVECEAEAEACRDLGFELAQGYHFGRPQPLAQAKALWSSRQ